MKKKKKKKKKKTRPVSLRERTTETETVCFARRSPTIYCPSAVVVAQDDAYVGLKGLRNGRVITFGDYRHSLIRSPFQSLFHRHDPPLSLSLSLSKLAIVEFHATFKGITFGE